MDLLVSGEPPRVRLYAAANPSLIPPLADRLLADPDPYVRGVAATHPAATGDALARLADGMTEPAWILRRIAAHPACPAQTSDELLTWLALGGATNADPMFDPVECTGHPADTSASAFAWYRQQAQRTGADEHPLWRVRAAVLGSGGRISANRAWALARDPRRDVRRVIARAGLLPLNIRLELRRDADQTAAAAAYRLPGSSGGARRAIVLLLRLAPVGAVIGGLLSMMNTSTPAPQVIGSTAPPGAPAEPLMSPSVLVLDGNGILMCGKGQTDPGTYYVSVGAGSEQVTLQFAGPVKALYGSPVTGREVGVPASTFTQVILPDGPTVITVQTGSGAPATWKGCIS
ncbi:MAG TPA: HEAT repeat domain-containing protein [Trebonia sp.]